MNTGFPFPRVALAIGISLLMHSLLMWNWVEMEPAKEVYPPLQAKLQPLPTPVQTTRPKPVKHAPVASTSMPQHDAAPATAANIGGEPTASAEPIPDASNEAPTRPPLPRHAKLTFAVQYGNGHFKVGEVTHVLELEHDRYQLRAVAQTTGIASLLKNFVLQQDSTGLVTAQGFRPERYTEERAEGSGKQVANARFDWQKNKIYFAHGASSPLPEQAQDILSLSYQLSQMPLGMDSFPVAMSNGRNINQYLIAVGQETVISTAMGELRTLPLHKVPSPNEDGLMIWLALEYRLLPVKIQYLGKTGEVTANMLITDIRVSDD